MDWKECGRKWPCPHLVTYIHPLHYTVQHKEAILEFLMFLWNRIYKSGRIETSFVDWRMKQILLSLQGHYSSYISARKYGFICIALMRRIAHKIRSFCLAMYTLQVEERKAVWVWRGREQMALTGQMSCYSWVWACLVKHFAEFDKPDSSVSCTRRRACCVSSVSEDADWC
jgi:hypothetical protein